MNKLIKEYFERVFIADDSVSTPAANSEISVINESQKRILKTEVTFEEFTCALKQMHLDKASGPDGCSPKFFQHF